MQRSEQSRARPVSERGRETDEGWKRGGEGRGTGAACRTALAWRVFII